MMITKAVVAEMQAGMKMEERREESDGLREWPNTMRVVYYPRA